MKKLKRFFVLALALLMLAQTAPVVSAASNKYFTDVPAGIWYEDELNAIMDAQAMMGSNNIIAGYADEKGNPTGMFGPRDYLTRAQFIKMILEAVSVTGASVDLSDHSMDKVHWAGKYYQAAKKDNLLVADVYSGSTELFPCTRDELQKLITRGEMAVILSNLLTNIGMDSVVEIDGAENYIGDYSSINQSYLSAVEQVWGKKLIMGYTDGKFKGDNSLTRAEAVTVVYRFLFQYNINGKDLAEFASRPGEADKVVEDANFVPFAKQYKSMTTAQQRQALFGDANKSYFYSAADAAPYMTDVTIPIWTMDKTGNKFSSTMTITVHKLVAKEISLIFQEIYDDPERFPIYGGWSVGGARFTDTMRHNWGCAIDINALYNCECNYYHNSGQLQVTCGYGYWPIGTKDFRFAGSVTQPSPYSIGGEEGEYGYSVVKAFAKYGWGWGGQGYSVQSNGRQKFDFMHFSILSSGG